MQSWEYLEFYANVYSGSWADSLGRSGKLTTIYTEGRQDFYHSVSPTLNRLGGEVCGVWGASNSSRCILLKRPK